MEGRAGQKPRAAIFLRRTSRSRFVASRNHALNRRRSEGGCSMRCGPADARLNGQFRLQAVRGGSIEPPHSYYRLLRRDKFVATHSWLSCWPIRRPIRRRGDFMWGHRVNSPLSPPQPFAEGEPCSRRLQGDWQTPIESITRDFAMLFRLDPGQTASEVSKIACEVATREPFLA